MTQSDLLKQVEELASKARSNHRLGESYVIEAHARAIQSNLNTETAIRDLAGRIRDFDQKAAKQSKQLVRLTWTIAGLTLLLILIDKHIL